MFKLKFKKLYIFLLILPLFIFSVKLSFAQTVDDKNDTFVSEKTDDILSKQDSEFSLEAKDQEKAEKQTEINSVPDLMISPVVIDDKAKARDILKKIIKISNNTDRKLILYPSVNNINPNTGKEEFKQAFNAGDRADSLANWIEISRGSLELKPGEEKNISFIIRVNLNAVPGNYHAQISFSEGSTRQEAEAKEKKASLMVNLEVLEDIKEELQLGKFITDRIFFSGDDVLFKYDLENIGNKEVTPEGEIRIYNRKGEEVATINANKDNKIFGKDKLGQLASVWNAGSGFGRYKAFLNLSYGENRKGTIQDTVFFWVVPWKLILGIFGASFLAVIFFASVFHRWLERKRVAPLRVEAEPFSKEEKTPVKFKTVSYENNYQKKKIKTFDKDKQESKRRKWFLFKRKKEKISDDNKKKNLSELLANDVYDKNIKFETASANLRSNKKLEFSQAVAGAVEVKHNNTFSKKNKIAVVNLKGLGNFQRKDSGAQHTVDLRKK